MQPTRQVIVLDRTIFYAQGGGQPGDRGTLTLADGTAIPVMNTVYGPDRALILHLLPPGSPLPRAGETVTLALDWPLRHARMRVHTALHLLSVVLPYPVTGGAIGDGEGRLDFDLPEASLDRDEIAAKLQAMIDTDAAVSDRWITDDELLANPGLVKTMSVKPPMGSGSRAPRRDRGAGSSALRRHACAAHRRDRQGERHRHREEGPAEQAGADRIGMTLFEEADLL